MKDNTVSVHNGGFVTLLESNANDLDIVNAARVSYNTYHEEMTEGDEKLISYLIRNRHGSPFEHTFFKFRVRLPIFVAREWIRHRIGNSFNEVSGRYTTIDMGYYLPESSHVRKQIGKPGNYSYGKIDDSIHNQTIRNAIKRSSSRSIKEYEVLLDLGAAPELARIVLPVNAYTEWIWSVNARSLMSFLSLRADGHAQREIQDYAYAVEELFKQTMPITWQAWNNNDRIAP